jgi:hypothetical protein
MNSSLENDTKGAILPVQRARKLSPQINVELVVAWKFLHSMLPCLYPHSLQGGNIFLPAATLT